MAATWLENSLTTIVNQGVGGHSYNSVVHMKNAKKRVIFYAKCHSHELLLGVKMCLFLRKRVLLDFSGAFRGHFSNSTKHVSKKACLGVNLGTSPNFSLRGVFPGEGKSQFIRYVLKISGHTCVQH